jgi:hypothetical protein
MKVFGVDDAIMGLQELELPTEGQRLHQIAIQKLIALQMVQRNDAVVVHNRVTGGRGNAV